MHRKCLQIITHISVQKNSFLVFKSATLQYSFYTKTFENMKIAIIYFSKHICWLLPFLALEFVAGTRKGEKIRYYLWLKGGEASIELWLISLDRIWFYTDKAKFIYCLCRSRKTCRIRLVAKGKSRVQTRTSGRRKLVKIDFITTSGNVKGTNYGRPIRFFFYNIPTANLGRSSESGIFGGTISQKFCHRSSLVDDFALYKSFFLQKDKIFIHFKSIP